MVYSMNFVFLIYPSEFSFYQICCVLVPLLCISLLGLVLKLLHHLKHLIKISLNQSWVSCSHYTSSSRWSIFIFFILNTNVCVRFLAAFLEKGIIFLFSVFIILYSSLTLLSSMSLLLFTSLEEFLEVSNISLSLSKSSVRLERSCLSLSYSAKMLSINAFSTVALPGLWEDVLCSLISLSLFPLKSH